VFNCREKVRREEYVRENKKREKYEKCSKWGIVCIRERKKKQRLNKCVPYLLSCLVGLKVRREKYKYFSNDKNLLNLKIQIYNYFIFWSSNLMTKILINWVYENSNSTSAY
jgi:hypothetical protein